MHTPLCRHAHGEPEEYAAQAFARGLKGIIVTCHNPTPYRWWHCMDPEQLPDYLKSIERARVAWAGRIDVRAGIECDYLPDLEDYLREQLAGLELNHVLGSIHPQVSSYREQFYRGDAFEYQKTYFENLAKAAESGLFDTLSHPDLVKNEAPDEWNLERIWPDVERALDRIAATGVAMELNTSGLLKAIKEMNPNPSMLRAMRVRNIPVVIGADAHIPARAADKFEEAIDLLEVAGYERVSFFLERKRQDVPLSTARSSLRTVDLG